MKTIQELYDEVLANQELKEKLVAAMKAGKQEEFLKDCGCGATVEEVAAFLWEKAREDAPISLDELDNASGGGCMYTMNTTEETFLSVLSIGLGCAARAAISAAKGHVGMQEGDSGRLCNHGK